MDFLGGLIGGGLNLIGGLFGQQNQANINAQNLAFAEQMATSGIQMRVNDAKAAGINPLAALGYNSPSLPTMVGSDSLASGIGKAGQDIGRAVASVMSPEDKANKARETSLLLEGKQLDNDIKRAELASTLAKHNQAGNAPGIPTAAQRYLIPGQPLTTVPGTGSLKGGDSALAIKPNERTSVDPTRPGQEFGHVPESSMSVAPSGALTPLSSKNFQERTSNDSISNAVNALKYRWLPSFLGGEWADPGPPPPGKVWAWNPLLGSYYPEDYRYSKEYYHRNDRR